MAGRHRNPNADFKVILHQTGGYRYAATQPYEKDKSGKERRHYVYWGDVTEEMKFIPNQRFCLADSDTRSKLEFPVIVQLVCDITFIFVNSFTFSFF